jgi:hypothetical protein
MFKRKGRAKRTFATIHCKTLVTDPCLKILRLDFINSSVSIVIRLQAGGPEFDFWKDRIFVFASSSRPAVGSINFVSIGYRVYVRSGKSAGA